MAAAYVDNSGIARTDASNSFKGVLGLTLIATAVLIGVVLVALWLASRELEASRAAHADVQRTREALQALQSVLSTLQDAETGARGFVITGRDTYLEPFRAAERALGTQLESLGFLDPDLAAQREELAASAREQFDYLRQLIALRQLREGAADELMATDVGKQRMDSIRARIQALLDHEEARLSARHESFQERSGRSQRLVLFAMLLAAGLIGFAGWLVHRHTRQRIDAQHAAHEAFDLLRASMDNLSQGVAVFDAQHRLIAWNERFVELRGLSASDVAANPSIDALAARAGTLKTTTATGTFETSRTMHVANVLARLPFDHESAREDGSVLRVQGHPMPNDNYIVTYADITDIKQSEFAYRDQATRLAAILDNVVDAIITINESGSIESWSNGAERLFGYKSEEVLRRNVKILMPDPHSSAHDGYIRRYLQTGERRIIGSRREVEALHKDGHRVPVDLGISEMRIGKRRMFIGIVRDISDRLEVERMKSGFVSTVSHELRTPLTSISGSLGLLAGGVAGQLPSKATHLIEIARQNSERLVRLINDILDLEKAESGRLDFRLEAQRLQPILQQAIELNRAYAQGFGVTIELDPHSDDPDVLVDRDRLVQVLTNLLSNAAKFSPRGGVVTVRARTEDDSVCVSVADQGQGIPPEFQGRIFQKFAQADSSDSRAKGGTGLGLSIAKTIIERLGGNIDFESISGKGSTFRIHLPIPYQPAPRRLPSPSIYPGPAVLVCEDDPDVATILAEMLRKEGMRAETVPTARAARAALDAVRFDIAIIDLHLPDTDGLEFIADLRGRAATRDLPVIVVTARPRGMSDSHQVGALHLADWLQKPIDPQRLLDSIRFVLARPRQRRARILHVEDDDSLTEMVRSLLESEAEMTIARTLAGARATVEAEEFDLVILDITLDDGSGLDLLPLLGKRRVRPAVILYSATQPTPEISGMVEAALVKSRDSLDELLSSVRTLVRRNA